MVLQYYIHEVGASLFLGREGPGRARQLGAGVCKATVQTGKATRSSLNKEERRAALKTLLVVD